MVISNTEQNIACECSESFVEVADLIADKLRASIMNRDMDLWLRTIYSEDDIANEAQIIWFKCYLLDKMPCFAEFEIINVSVHDSSLILKCKINLEYEKFNKVEEIHVYTIRYIEVQNDYKVVWLNKIRKPFMDEQFEAQSLTFQADLIDINPEWWSNEALIKLSYGICDPDSPMNYARAVTRNIRFRETISALECASILSNMMSLRLTSLAKKLYRFNRLHFLSAVYNASKDKVLVKLVRDDRDNTWSSKFTAPWYGFDELVSLSEDDIISGNCSSYMSFLYAMLRLGGFDKQDVVQLRLGNQDVLTLTAEGKNYLITSEKIEEITEKTIYYNKDVTKVFSDYWFLTSQGITNLDEIDSKRYMNYLKCSLPIFNFNMSFKARVMSIPEDFEYRLPDVGGADDISLLNLEIRKHIFSKSREYIDSPYTWAKYAFQTILVSKPQAYAIWSLQSPLIASYITEHDTFLKFIKDIKQYGQKSIFCEKDRIMTADQVVRHKTCDNKAKALLFFSWLKTKREKNSSFVLLTTKGDYCVEEMNNENKFWDMESLNETKEIKGKILLAFNESYSYYPLLRKEVYTEITPAWLLKLENIKEL
ncbi:hypothetical protein acsn021_24130 [Anaerocolumna cellulosilytica]|uniref:Uncharacterized protein n=1 Tax=Anaerocolumna cellulosilytica TaxID=433286 RepID=A0A6S6QW60_9FIRM|nr:hypothetical protein [Anaerocolumna cellulosilytica]MBB5193942.1 hypothetical protein [Anaerocolumna cellulosilytica]BCJ94844.1 hypothetical protein acsn021_24130 [Anaerocolumna cellulosilytica]